MCIQFPPYLHQKSSNWLFGHRRRSFFGADAVIKSVSNSTIRMHFLYHDAKFAMNIMQIGPKYKNKGADGTKMHRCLVEKKTS